jgi:competence protein ComEC
MPERGENEWGGERPGASAREGLLAALLGASARALEREQDRWFLWLSVLFAGGIVTYFALTDAPAVRVTVALLVGAVGLALAMRHAPLALCIGGAALAFASGFAAAKLRTETVRAPVLAHELRFAKVAGFVEQHELRDKGRARLTLRLISLDGVRPDERCYRSRVTMTAKDASNVWIGKAVAFTATLRPPPEPIEPGRFDFGRQAWFARIGATGYATSKVELLAEAPPPPWDLAAWGEVDALRAQINARIRTALSGETREIATALITGERGGIAEELTEAMRDSGLAHILSISGLHMAIMAGTVFWLVRAVLALVPALALRYPIKKWAATFYLALSGAAVPTVRSWIMMSIVLVAVMLDRPALTMRNVALAALAILIVSPESLFDPSFEMSFAAVIGLVALYEWLSKRERDRLGDISPVWAAMRRGWSLISGAALTTLVAGTAIGPLPSTTSIA